MRAISQRAFGGPAVLELTEIDEPTPGPGEVQLRVRAAGVNPADWKARAGLLTPAVPDPFVLGLDVAGVVSAIGPDVTRFRVGDDVYGYTMPPRGSHAEYTVAAESALAAADGLEPVTAAALPIAALTAWQPLAKIAGIRPGQRVLVHAAAGGVGHLAVQLAKSMGAHVTGTARPANHAFLRDLGADALIDYTSVDFAALLRDIDVVIDPIGDAYGPRSLQVLAPGGTLIDVRGAGPDRTETRTLAAQQGHRYVEFRIDRNGADLDHITTLVAQGTLRVVVSQTLPLADAAKAHELIETGRTQGKLVLLP